MFCHMSVTYRSGVGQCLLAGALTLRTHPAAAPPSVAAHLCSHMTSHMLPHVNTLYCTLVCTRVCRWGELQAYGWAATSLLIHALDPKALEQLRPALAAAAARKDASACIIGMAQRLSRELTPVGQHLAAHVLTSCTVPGARGGGFPSYLHPHPHPIFSMNNVGNDAAVAIPPASQYCCMCASRARLP